MKAAVILAIALTIALTARAQLSLLPGDATIAPAAGDQAQPAIARGSNSVLAVWSDTRANPYGTSDYETARDIYGVRLDAAGNLLDPVPIPICVAPAAQDFPKVAWNGRHWLVVFETQDVSGSGMYYQKTLAAVRVAPTGQVLDARPIPLHGLTPANYNTWALASDGNNWVVVNQGTPTSGDIVAVRVSPAGVVLDPPTRAIVKETYYMRSNIKLAHAGGVFLCTFNDYSDTKYVRFDSNLNLLTPPTTLLTDSLHDLASNGTGFYAIWTRQNADFTLSLAGSRISTTGSRLDGNGVNISGSRAPYGINHSVTWDGVNWRVLWGEYATTYIARVNSSGSLLSPGSVAVPGILPGPMAGLGGAAQPVWTAYTNNNNDVFTANLSGANTVTGLRALSTGAPQQWRPDVATSGNGYMVVYLSSTAAGNRVLAQPLDAAGNPLTAEPVVLANLPTIPVPVALNSASPSVAWNGAVYLVTWGTTNAVVGQRLLPNGTKLDPAPFTILPNAFGPTDVAAVGDIFLVTSRKYGFTPQNIFAYGTRVRGSDGAVLDTLGVGGAFVSRPPVVTALSDRFFVAYISNWTHDNPGADTVGVFVPVIGTGITQFGIYQFSTAGGNFIFELGLAASGNTALLVQPAEITSGVENDLIGWLINSAGTVSPMINFTPWAGNQYRPRVAWDGTNFILAYQDQKNRLAPHALDQLDARSDLFAMRVSPTGAKIDPQGFVFTAFPTAETDPTVCAHNGTLLLAGAVMVNEAPFANYRIVYDLLPGNLPVAVATATPAAGDIPLTVNFSSAGSTAGSYHWDFGDGTPSTLAHPSRTYTAAAPYLVTLTVNGTTRQAILVNATKPNQVPVAIATADKYSGNAPLSVVFSAAQSYDPDGLIGNIEWQFSDDGSSYWGATAYHTFNTTGNHTVTLRCYDARGGVGTTNLVIRVGSANQPPVARASATPTTGAAPLTVQFSSAGSSDPDGTITGYQWNFGDGGTSTAANPSYTYTVPGTYTATLTVRDNHNATATASVVITVNPAGNTLLRSTAINLSAKAQGKKINVTGDVVVKDAAGSPVSGAVVAATWTKPGGTTESRTATTSTSGVARFTTSGGSGTYTLTVTNITKSGYTFDRTNSVLSASITR